MQMSGRQRLMKKKNTWKLILMAAGILISAAFYVSDPDSGFSAGAGETPVVFAEPGAGTRAGEPDAADSPGPEDTGDAAEEAGTAAVQTETETLLSKEELEELVRTAVREELLDICREGYLEQALQAASEAAAAEAEARKGMVDLNHAGKQELMTLEGIGEKRAADILAYREAHGGFRSTEEIKQVSGIKESAYAKIADKIYIGD